MESGRIVDLLSEEEQYLLKSYIMVKNNPSLKKIADEMYQQQQAKEHKSRKISQEIEQSINSILSKEELTSKFKTPIKIYVDGVFDIIHSGHFNAFRQAKKLGDILVVGVNSDEDVLKVKGPTILKDLERNALVAACKWVDETHPFTPYTPSLKLMDEYECQYCAHGDDMPTNENGQDCYTEIKEAGRMMIFKRTEGVSTTEIIGRLLSVSRNRIITKHDDSITGAELINQMTNFESSPVVSKFLTTGWRFVEFCNNKSPKPGDKIVYIDGDFDILHMGYLETLEKAKKLGDFLYVGIHDDTVVNSYKGRNYPILNLQERVLNVLAMRYVDDVVISAPLKVTDLLIRTLGINVVVLSNDQEKREVSDAYEIPAQMGLIVEVTSETPLNNDVFIERVELNRANYAKKFEKKKVAEEKYDASEKLNVQEI